MTNPYVTIYGPHPATWREYLTAILRARLRRNNAS